MIKHTIAQRKDIQFVIVGNGPLEEEARTWSKQAGVEDYVHFVGFTEDPFTYLAAADIFLLTSRWEALPISIVEAFRSGLPVIACDTGGVKELVVDDVGFVAPVEDVTSLTNYVLEMCGNNKLRSDMATAALERSRADRFDPQHINQLIEALYQKTI